MAINNRTPGQIKSDVTLATTTEANFREGMDDVIDQVTQTQVDIGYQADLSATDGERGKGTVATRLTTLEGQAGTATVAGTGVLGTADGADLSGTFANPQIVENAVGSLELGSSSTDNDARAVANSHIKTGTISNDRLINPQVTLDNDTATDTAVALGTQIPVFSTTVDGVVPHSGKATSTAAAANRHLLSDDAMWHEAESWAFTNGGLIPRSRLDTQGTHQTASYATSTANPNTSAGAIGYVRLAANRTFGLDPNDTVTVTNTTSGTPYTFSYFGAAVDASTDAAAADFVSLGSVASYTALTNGGLEVNAGNEFSIVTANRTARDVLTYNGTQPEWQTPRPYIVADLFAETGDFTHANLIVGDVVSLTADITGHPKGVYRLDTKGATIADNSWEAAGATAIISKTDQTVTTGTGVNFGPASISNSHIITRDGVILNEITIGTPDASEYIISSDRQSITVGAVSTSTDFELINFSNSDSINAADLTGVVNTTTNQNIGGNKNFTGAEIRITGTGAGSTGGPDFVLHRDSASPAGGDQIGILLFNGEREDSTETTYAAVRAEIASQSNTQTQGRMRLRTRVTSGTTSDVTIQAGHVLPNADSTNDLGSTAGSWRNVYVDNIIGDDSVDTANITDANVTTAKIADEAITEAKLNITSGMELSGNILTSDGSGGFVWSSGDSISTSVLSRFDVTTVEGTTITLPGTSTFAASHLLIIDGLTLNEGIDYNISTDRRSANLNDTVAAGRDAEIINFATAQAIGAGEANANILGTGTISTDVTVQSGSIAEGTLAADRIVDNSITATQLANNSVGTDQIELGGTGHWDFQVGADNRLDFRFNGTVVFSIGSNGSVISADDITAFGTP